ncbi:unnamed protein product, partial [Adineta steineri]
LLNSNSDNQQHLSTLSRYLPSQYLFDSSLTDELAIFDFISTAISQQQLNSLPEKSLGISLFRIADDKSALFESTADDKTRVDLVEINLQI